MAPFETGLSPVTRRITSAGVLAVVFAVARLKRRTSGDEFPGDEYRLIQAMAWLGIYAYLNLQLSSFRWIFPVPAITGRFYWLTYAAIWLLPAIGLVAAIRAKDRPLLDVNIVLGLVTLATNKPYLGATRQTWDPILLGIFLIGTAVVVRRRLSRDRNGFTAARILLSDRRGISVLGTASSVLHPIPQMPIETPPTRNLDPGGGRSGGAGASGSF